MNRIKEVRKAKGIGQKELAKATGTTQQAISLYERGQREPRLDMWEKISECLKAPVIYLQGKCISKAKALDLLSGWLTGENTYYYSDFDMKSVLQQYLSNVGVDEKTLDKAMKSKKVAKQVIAEKLQSINSYVFLSDIVITDDDTSNFEDQIVSIIGNGSTRATATLYTLKFSDDEERNFDIAIKLSGIIEDIYTLIDKQAELNNNRFSKLAQMLTSKNSSRIHSKNKTIRTGMAGLNNHSAFYGINGLRRFGQTTSGLLLGSSRFSAVTGGALNQNTINRLRHNAIKATNGLGVNAGRKLNDASASINHNATARFSNAGLNMKASNSALAHWSSGLAKSAGHWTTFTPKHRTASSKGINNEAEQAHVKSNKHN